MHKFIKTHLGVFVLFLAVLVLFLRNYSPGIWLTGWDNLQTEFDHVLNIKRSLSAVWQEYQGLGLVGGNAHAADLTRQLFLFALSFFIPQSLLRYVFFFLMLFIGGWGCFWFLTSPAKRIQQIGLVGALFYILNLATLQTFYIPFEPFAVQFAFLPWLIGSVLQFLHTGNKRDGLFFVGITLLSIPQFFIPTVFIVYGLFLSIIFFSHLLRHQDKETFKKISFISVMTFCMNAFWILPFLYFVITNVQVTTKAKINEYGTQRVIAQNKKYGTLHNVIILKGFAMDNLSLSLEKEFQYIMPQWRIYTQNALFVVSSYIAFFIALMGIFHLRKKNPVIFKPFFIMFLFVFTILLNNTPPFSLIVSFLQNHIPLFGQVFRASFTKFSLILGFFYSVFFAFGLDYLITNIKKIPARIFFIFSLIILFIISFPSWQGNFIYPRARVSIPKEYFDLFAFFKTVDKNARIANLPQPWFWGWSIYNWGYDGSGFLWYGIEQPILDRAFDVWSKEDENYYWEISRAISSQNINLFQNVLQKYQVQYVIFDKNIRSYPNYKGLSIELLEDMLKRSSLQPIQSFEDKIIVYSTGQESLNGIFFGKNLPEVSPSYEWNDEDTAFSNHGTYVNGANGYFYPFRTLFSSRNQNEIEFTVKNVDNSFIFEGKLPESDGYKKGIIPEISDRETRLFLKNYKEIATYPQIVMNTFTYLINNKNYTEHSMTLPKKVDTFSVAIDKLDGYYSYTSVNHPEIFNSTIENCDLSMTGELKREIDYVDNKALLRFISKNANNCFHIDLSYLSQRLSYLVHIKSKFISGNPLLFYMVDNATKKGFSETYLVNNKGTFADSYFIIPSQNPYGVGYTLYVSNISFDNSKTINELQNIEVYPIPYEFIKNIRLENNIFVEPTYQNIDFEKKQLFLYKFNSIPIQNYPSNTIIGLSQSYNQGWKAWMNGQELKDHVLVNNWANGWRVPSTENLKSNNLMSNIVIIFWPQYLEFVGFGILIATGIGIVLYHPRS